MSIIWTHIQFSEDIVDSIQKTDDYAAYERYMKLGTQMTNLIYLYNQRIKKKNSYNEINVSANEQVQFLINLIKEVKNYPKFVQAFVFGLLTHYILEKEIRPYLIYLNNEFNCEEFKCESQIDTLIMKKTYNLETWKTPVYNEINIGLLIDRHIIDLLKLIKHPISKHLQQTYIQFIMTLRYYFDPYGWKSKLLPSYHPMYRPFSELQNGIDYLNICHEEWINPSTKETSTNNFFQLYDEIGRAHV